MTKAEVELEAWRSWARAERGLTMSAFSDVQLRNEMDAEMRHRAEAARRDERRQLKHALSKLFEDS